MVEKTKLFPLPRQHFGFFEDWRNFRNPQKIGKFLKLGVALILPYLLTLRFITYSNKIGSSATRTRPD